MGCWFDNLRFNSQQGQDIYPLSKMSIPYLGLTKPPILGVKGPDIQVSTPFTLVLRLRVSGAIHVLPYMPARNYRVSLTYRTY